MSKKRGGGNNSTLLGKMPLKERRAVEKEDRRMERECKGCFYRKGPRQFRHCDYLSMTGKVRPCPPGKECTVRVSLKTVRRGNCG